MRTFPAVAAAVVLTLLAGCTSHGRQVSPPSPTASESVDAAPTPAATFTPPETAAYYHQQLAWTGCGGAFQCATLHVPLNYDDPASRLIDIAVVKLPASDPGKRIGALVVNPGGPGGSGIEYARAAPQIVTKAIRAQFDIVGFDPRGVGASTPVRCVNAKEMDAYLSVDAVPESGAAVAAIEHDSKAFADGCLTMSGDLLPFVGTRDAVRDMDVLRAALGEPKLTYLGKSYGTYLGAIYAETFPTKIRALVLDGAVDPSLTGEEMDRVQAQGFEAALQAFITDCVKRSTCPLGTSASAANASLDRLLAQVRSMPLPAPVTSSDRTVGWSAATTGIAAALYDKGQGWPLLRTGLRRALDGDGSVLLMLSDTLSGRQPDGTYDNSQEANIAINCVDHPAPRDPATFVAAAKAYEAEAPHFGAYIAWYSMVCAYWQVEPTLTPGPVHAEGAPPIVVVGTTRDPATPYAWAQALASQLSSGILVTYEGDGHTAYDMGSSCVDKAIDAYLIDLTVPGAGKRCS